MSKESTIENVENPASQTTSTTIEIKVIDPRKVKINFQSQELTLQSVTHEYAAQLYKKIVPTLVESESFEPEIQEIKVTPNDIALGEIEKVNVKDFDIDDQSAKNLVREIVDFTCNYQKVFAHLKNFDAELEQEIQKHPEFAQDDNYLPQYFIKGLTGFYIPGPRQDNYHPYSNKGRIFDKVLNRKEKEFKINESGAATFVGYVDPKIANKFVADGNVFKEDIQMKSFRHHGKNSHRLIILALCNYLKDYKYINKSGQECPLLASDILKLLVSSKVEYILSNETQVYKISKFDSLWNFALDNVIETEEFYKKQDYESVSFSSRSPFTLTSLFYLLDDLPAVKKCMLDSYYKHVDQAVDRIINKINNDEAKPILSVDNEKLRNLVSLFDEITLTNLSPPGYIVASFGSLFEIGQEDRGKKYESFPNPEFQHQNIGMKPVKLSSEINHQKT